MLTLGFLIGCGVMRGLGQYAKHLREKRRDRIGIFTKDWT